MMCDFHSAESPHKYRPERLVPLVAILVLSLGTVSGTSGCQRASDDGTGLAAPGRAVAGDPSGTPDGPATAVSGVTVGDAGPSNREPAGGSRSTADITDQIAAAQRRFAEEEPGIEPDVEILTAIVASETSVAPPAMLAGVRSPGYRAVSGAALRLGESGCNSVEAIEALIDAAAYSDNSNVTRSTEQALIMLDPLLTVPALVAKLDSEWDYLARKSWGNPIRDVLMQVGHRNLPCLLDVVQKQTPAIPEVRITAALAAAKAGAAAEPVIPFLLDMLNGNARYRAPADAVAQALGEIGIRTDAVVAALVSEIRKEGGRRDAAFEALKDLDPEAAVNSGYFAP